MGRSFNRVVHAVTTINLFLHTGGDAMTRIETNVCDRRTALGIIGCAAMGALSPLPAQAKVLPIKPGSWTIVVLPDTQYYAQTWPQHFDAQTKWIARHAR